MGEGSRLSAPRMKIILSRKGFDTQYGGQPSPILPDGTLLSLPIPVKEDIYTFGQLKHNGKSYYEIIRELKPGTKLKATDYCHPDPDLREAALPRAEGWKPLFGQADSAQGHLLNQRIGEGDLFLFFGTFRQAELREGRYRYMPGSPEVHLIFGYLQIGALHTDFDTFSPLLPFHSHAQPRFSSKRLNCLYEASPDLSLAEHLPGSGTLSFHEALVLTKKGYPKSRWALPSFFRDVPISYHSAASHKEGYFQSAAKGQEFILPATGEIKTWTKSLIVKSAIKNPQ